MPPHNRLVYSTDDPDAGRDRRADKRRPPSMRSSPALGPPTQPPGVRADTVYVERIRKGRAGKTVTLVLNLPYDDAAKAALLKELKVACGAGGTLKDGVVEIQGDHRDRLVALFKERGLAVKARGG